MPDPSRPLDPAVSDLLRRSPGWNLGMDFLPGALDLDPAAFAVDPGFAGRVLWFDALVGNVDRTWRNVNMLRWHGEPWLIDHGATLTFHHAWTGPEPPEVVAAGSSLEHAAAPRTSAPAMSGAAMRRPRDWRDGSWESFMPYCLADEALRRAPRPWPPPSPSMGPGRPGQSWGQSPVIVRSIDAVETSSSSPHSWVMSSV